MDYIGQANPRRQTDCIYTIAPAKNMPRSTQNQVIERNDESLGIVLGLGTSGVNPTLKQGIILSDGGGGLADCSEAILMCPSGPTLCNETAQLTGSVIIGHEACKSAETAAKLINNVVIGHGALESPTLGYLTKPSLSYIGHSTSHKRHSQGHNFWF